MPCMVKGHDAVFVFQAVDPDEAVFRIHAERKVRDFVIGFIEIPSDEADGLDGMNFVVVGHQAARASQVLRQFHGRSSSRQPTGWSAIRPRTSASQAWGSTSLSRQVSISELATAARYPPRSEPQNSHDLRPSGTQRTARSPNCSTDKPCRRRGTG